MDFMPLDSIFSEVPFGNYRELPLYQALYQSEERAFQELEKLQEPLSLRDSARCLHKAMQDCSVELFRQILEHSEPGECTEQYHIYQAKNPGWGIHCHGSMVTMAAVVDRPRQAALLLEHGCDANGGGLAVTDYLRQDGKRWGDGPVLNVQNCGSNGCSILVHRPEEPDIGISCVTPLAAALLCGNLQTAEVLLCRPDVWKKESSAVCRAAVMVLEGVARPVLSEEKQRGQLEILRQIFCPEQAVLPDRKTFLRSVYLQPASFVDFCQTRTLQYQLESGLCTEEDARKMLEFLNVDLWWHSRDYDRSRAGKMLLLKQHFPKLCRESWVTGIFLRETVRRIREELPYKSVLNAWKQLCGKERDLTWLGSNIWLMKWSHLNRFLQEAGEDGTLVMDADALSQFFGTTYRSMLTVLKNIRFRYRDGKGVNGLMQHLVLSGDLRLLRYAAKMGILETEDPKLLLECLSETENNRQDVRAMVLTFARNQPNELREMADWQDMRRWKHWCLWEQADEETAQGCLRELLYQNRPEEDCLKNLFRLHQYLGRGFFSPDMKLEHPDYPTMEADSLAAFVCCAETALPMKVLMEHLPNQLQNLLRADWGERFFFCGTPLTLAAALGRTEQVKLLLESGIHPDEAGRGDRSRFFVRTSDFAEDGFPVTPVLAAILFGQEETARLLLDHGASCDFANLQHRKVLMQGSARTLQLAESLPNVGFEQIPAEAVKALRIMTAEHGERTRFWESLRQQVNLF